MSIQTEKSKYGLNWLQKAFDNVPNDWRRSKNFKDIPNDNNIMERVIITSDWSLKEAYSKLLISTLIMESSKKTHFLFFFE